MAVINDFKTDDFSNAIRRHITAALTEFIDDVILDLTATAQKRIETEARDYAARTVLTLSRISEIREMRDRIVIELRLPPKDGQ